MTFIKNNSYILLIFVVCIGFTLFGISQLEEQEDYTEIVIAEGDTLWKLAHHHAEDMPTDKWIRRVMQLNGLEDVTIRSGNELRVPDVRYNGNGKNKNQMAGVGQ